MSVFCLEGAVLLVALSPAAWYNIGLVVVLVALAIAGVMAYHVWHEVNEEIEPATAFVGSFGTVMVVHTGPGLVGLAWRWEPL